VRILLDYRPALRQRTGAGHYVHELAAAMLPRLLPDESLALFSSSWKDRLEPGVLPGATVVDARVPVRVLNLAWHRLEWPPVERFAGPVDVAHSTHPLLLPSRDRALRAVTVYDLDFLDHPGRTRAEIRRDYPALAPRHVQRADLVVVISEHTAREVRDRLGVPADRIVLCRPGAPPASAAPRPERPGPILFVGTIEPRKNLATLFAAYEELVARNPAAPPLILAGAAVEQSAEILGALGARTAIAGRVEYRGYVSDAERQALYASASMLVLPSFHEGFGMPAVEAMQAGVPVIVSTGGALPEVVGTAGITVDPVDVAGFSTAMERLLADPAERVRRAEAGREQARLFSWSSSAATLLEAYRETCARRAARR
jgi:glycosyltransferase involved in cell wall biosynthesis